MAAPKPSTIPLSIAIEPTIESTPLPTPEPVVAPIQPVPHVPVASRAVYVDGQYDALLQVHFGSSWGYAKKIMLCESGGRSDAHNGNASTGDDSWGLFQINRFGKLALTRPAPSLLVDPEFNIRYAAGMWRAQGWKPWSCRLKI